MNIVEGIGAMWAAVELISNPESKEYFLQLMSKKNENNENNNTGTITRDTRDS